MDLARLPELATGWAAFMGEALLDGTLVFLLAALLWLPLRGRAPAQLGYGLFLLVLLELALPLQIPAPAWLAALSPTHALQGLLAGTGSAAAGQPAIGGTFPADTTPLAAPVPVWGPETWLLLAWIAVVTVLLARFAWLQLRTARIVARARRPRAGELGVDPADLHGRIGLRRPVLLRITDELDAPAAGGLFRPFVLLPEGLPQRLSVRSLSWVLLHELAHVRRRDAWVALLQRLMQIAFFFHPVVWLANRILDEQREFACDDAALLASGESRRACGEGFLSVVEWAQATRSVPVAALGAFRSRHLTRRRLMRMLDARRKPGSRSALFGGLFLAALGLLLAPNLEAQEGQGEIEQRIKQQEIAILKARLEKLRLESELLQIELQRLQGGGVQGEGLPGRGVQGELRFGGSLGRGGAFGGARSGLGVTPPGAPEAPEAPRATRRLRGGTGIGVPAPDVPEAAPAPRRRGRAGVRGGLPGAEEPEAAPRPRRSFGLGVPGARGRADVAPRQPRAPRAPRPPRALRGIGVPDARGGETVPEPGRTRARAPRARRALRGTRRGPVFGEVLEPEPPVPPRPPEPRRIVFDEFGPRGVDVEPEVLFEVVEDPTEVEETVAPEPRIDVLFEVEEAKPPESVLEIFEVPAETEAKPEPKAKPRSEPRAKPKASAPRVKRTG